MNLLGWKGKYSKLTQTGADLLQSIGESFRQKYTAFFEEIIAKKDARIIATSTSRIYESAYYFLTGLLGANNLTEPHPMSIWGDSDQKLAFLEQFNLALYPNELNIIYAAHTDLSPTRMKANADLMKTLWESKYMFEKFEHYFPLLEKLSNIEIRDFDYWVLYNIYDILVCIKEEGLPFPEGTSEEMMESLKCVPYIIFYDIWMKNSENRRLANHVIYSQLLQVLGNEIPSSFLYYSTHDANLIAFLIGLGSNVHFMPYFGDRIIIQIFSNKQIVISFEGNHGTQFIWEGTHDQFRLLLEEEIFENDDKFLESIGNELLFEEKDKLIFKLI